MKLALMLLLFLVSIQALAGKAVHEIPQVGEHYPLLTFEKSINPQNIMVIYTRLNKTCHLVRDPKPPKPPALDFYWLMNRSSFKPVNSLIKNGIRKRMQIEKEPGQTADGSNSFSVRVGDLDAVEHDLKSPRFVVQTLSTNEGCVAEAFMELGPSDGNAVIRVDSIYSEAELSGIMNADVKSITLNGKDTKTGKAVSRKYLAK